MYKAALMEELNSFNDCENYAEVELKLGAIFTGALLETTDSIPHPKIVDPNSKWRVSSCMQKAIRRGDSMTARKMASALITFDTDYFLRRINIIALEDIGLANPTLVAEILCMSGKKSYLTQCGLVRVAQRWAGGLAAGIKDRTLCELTCMTDYGKDFNGLKQHLQSYDFSNYTEVDVETLLWEHNEPATRVVAARFLAGTKKFSSDNFLHHEGCYEVFKSYMEHTLPRLVSYLAIKGSKKGTECLWVPVMESYHLLAGSKEWSIGVNPQGVIPKIKGVQAYAYDMHTMEGKKAYALFAKTCTPIRTYMESQFILQHQQLHAPAFIAETGILNRYVVYDGFTALMLAARKAEYESCSLNMEQGDNLRSMISNNIEQLWEARAKVCKAELEWPKPLDYDIPH